MKIVVKTIEQNKKKIMSLLLLVNISFSAMEATTGASVYYLSSIGRILMHKNTPVKITGQREK